MTPKYASILIVLLCVTVGCVSLRPGQVTNRELTKKQELAKTLQSEISIVLWNLETAQKKIATQRVEHAVGQEESDEYSIEAHDRDLDLTIKILTECKQKLVKQLREFRRTHEIPSK